MPLSDTSWHKLSASWPLDGQEVWLRSANSFMGPLKCLFSQSDLTFVPSSMSLDTPVALGIPWWYITEWRNTGALNPPSFAVWLVSSPADGVITSTLTGGFPVPATGWQLQYKPVGSPDPALLSAVVSTASISILGLTAGTVYEVQARYDMGAGPASSFTLPVQVTVSGAVMPLRPMRLLAVSAGPVVNDADPKVLFTCPIPAFTFTKQGDSAEALFIYDNPGAPPHFSYTLTGLEVYATDESFAGGRYVHFLMSRIDDTHLGIQYFDINNGAADYISVAVDFTADNDLTVTTSADATSGISLEFAKVRFEPAP